MYFNSMYSQGCSWERWIIGDKEKAGWPIMWTGGRTKRLPRIAGNKFEACKPRYVIYLVITVPTRDDVLNIIGRSREKTREDSPEK